MRAMEWIAVATGRLVDKLESITAKARAELAVDRLNYYDRLQDLERNMERVLELHQEAEEELRYTTEQLANEQERCERQAGELDRQQRALAIANQATVGWRESFMVANKERTELNLRGLQTQQAYQAMCEALDSRQWWVVVPDAPTTQANIFSSRGMAQAAHPERTIYGAKLIG